MAYEHARVVKVDGTKITVEIDATLLRPSSTGKSDLYATGKDKIQVPAIGKELTLQINGYVSR